MDSPFKFDVSDLDDAPERVTHRGPSPERIGVAMIAIPEGAQVEVDAQLQDVGSGVQITADISAPLHGQCSRCLARLERTSSFHIEQFFAADEGVFVDAPESDDDSDVSPEEYPVVAEGTVDLIQQVIDEVGLNLPFNPVCENGCEDSSEVPSPDGVSGEKVGVDPRWAGLEKYL